MPFATPSGSSVTTSSSSQSGHEGMNSATETAQPQGSQENHSDNGANWRSWIARDRQWPVWILGAFLALTVGLAYSNTLHGPFQYDDYLDILDNPTIRHLWPIRDVFYTTGAGFRTRPVANLTFAINYATGGVNPYHYHLLNLGIHVCAALALFGVLNRALVLPSRRGLFPGHVHSVALVTAAAWALHPLLTESVAYITQRYESLMGLFVLLTFYCFLRASSGTVTRVPWAGLTGLSCFLALGSKEVAVSVPFLVLLFDQMFISRSFRKAIHERSGLYLGILLAWACFAFLQFHGAKRTFAGFGLTMPWWQYALNQPLVILHYLRLSVWPHPLNFDYLWQAATSWRQLVLGLGFICCAGWFTIWSYTRQWSVAFLPISFFFILAPTSSVMPILDLAVEHRMYLPLVPVIVGSILGAYYLLFTVMQGKRAFELMKKTAVIILVAGTLSAFGTLTYLRNEEYQSAMDLWRDTVAKAPNNPRAHHNYGFFLAQEEMTEGALYHYRLAVEQAPMVAQFQGSYGVILSHLKNFPEALKHLRLAVELEPDNFKNYINLGGALLAKGSVDNSIICFQEAKKLNPGSALPYSALSLAMVAKHRLPEALEYTLKAVGIEPQNASLQYGLGRILLMLGDFQGANAAYQKAVRFHIHPEAVISNIGWDLYEAGKDQEAVLWLRKSHHLKPEFVKDRFRLAWILATSPDDSVRKGSEALELSQEIIQSTHIRTPELLDLLSVSLASVGRFPEAVDALNEALEKAQDTDWERRSAMVKRRGLFKARQVYRDDPQGRMLLSGQ